MESNQVEKENLKSESISPSTTKNNEINKLNWKANLIIIIRILLVGILLFIGIGIIEDSYKLSYNSTHHVSEILLIKAYNSMYEVYLGDYRTFLEAKSLIQKVSVHNSNRDEVYSYGSIYINYYGTIESEDYFYSPDKENTNNIISLIKNDKKYKISLASFNDYGFVSGINIIEQPNVREIPEVDINGVIGTQSKPVEKKVSEYVEPLEMIIGILLVVFMSLVIINIILLVKQKYSKAFFKADLIFMYAFGLPIEIIILLSSFGAFIEKEYLLFGLFLILAVLIIVAIIKNHYLYKKHRRGDLSQHINRALISPLGFLIIDVICGISFSVFLFNRA